MFYTTRPLDPRKGSAQRRWLIYFGRWLCTHTCLGLAIGALLMNNNSGLHNQKSRRKLNTTELCQEPNSLKKAKDGKMADGTGVFQTLSFILRGSFSH